MNMLTRMEMPCKFVHWLGRYEINIKYDFLVIPHSPFCVTPLKWPWPNQVLRPPWRHPNQVRSARSLSARLRPLLLDNQFSSEVNHSVIYRHSFNTSTEQADMNDVASFRIKCIQLLKAVHVNLQLIRVRHASASCQSSSITSAPHPDPCPTSCHPYPPVAIYPMCPIL